MLGAPVGAGRLTVIGTRMADLPLHPRLALRVAGAADAGLGWTGCVLAALLEDRDALRGRPDDLPTVVAERVALIAGPAAGDHHPHADRGAVHGARRRATELARRAGVAQAGSE